MRRGQPVGAQQSVGTMKSAVGGIVWPAVPRQTDAMMFAVTDVAHTFRKYVPTANHDPNDATITTHLSGTSDNQPPVANAGPDQTVTDTDNSGAELVTLDGSGATDPDGYIVSYV